MTVKEGKNLIRTCLRRIGSDKDIDTFICYKYANRKHANDYQRDDIVSKLTEEDSRKVASGIPFVVTCFLHMEIYAAWHQAVGSGNGKYVVYKRDLAFMENNPDYDYRVIDIGKADNTKVYLFRGESGIEKFLREQLKI